MENSENQVIAKPRSNPFRKTCNALFFSLVTLVTISPTVWAAPNSVYLEDLTWTEVHDDIQAGKNTIIIPVGGTEQSGPHMALGKHNVRAKVLAGKIASILGNALVAPVIAYVPEGSITPPSGHMRFVGTISVSDDAFQSILASAARSFKQNGFVNVILIGDHGGYQTQLKAVATRLNHDWASSPARAFYIADYYKAADSDFAQLLRSKGFTNEQIGVHAGTADTSLTLAVDPSLVRLNQMQRSPEKNNGDNGDPRPSTAALGQLGVDMIISKTVAAIRTAVAAPR
ncbi:creatininase family protein [Glaciimonas soli]|uniref:Creatininase family protein n=1 Tax=Glaciimonas soli TaxID=2590999 RepID=A0A843YN54_9BURK|nr:creatininase family protein [Glaciimonas soli]MQR00380.1 creatininase family protein [Glaciimonas soli]